VNLRGNVAGRDPGHFRYRTGCLAFEVEQDDLAVERLESVNQIQKDCRREPLIDLCFAVDGRHSSLEGFQVHQPRGQAASSPNVGSAHIVRNAIDPSPQTAAAVKRPEAHPQLHMHFLKQISLPVRIGLITTGQPTYDGSICGACLRIQRVLPIPIHRKSILPLFWGSLRLAQISYTPVLQATCATFLRELEGSSRVIPGYPVWMLAPVSRIRGWPERNWTGSSGQCFRPQKFETCPDWGAKLRLPDYSLSA